MIVKAVTLLPLPLSPTRATVSCLSTVKSTPSTTVVAFSAGPNATDRSSISSSAMRKKAPLRGSTTQNAVMTGQLDIEAYNRGL